MTSFQKVIKYFAIAFAVFLIVTIISSILLGVYVLGNVIGIEDSEEVNLEDYKVISNELSEITKLNIKLGATNLQIKSGDAFSVETNNPKISYSENNGSITIKENKHHFKANNLNSNLTIYLPDDMANLVKTEIDSGAGKVEIECLKTKDLDFDLGAGEVKIDNLIVTDKADIDGGIGRAEIKSSEINNLDADLGVGEFVLEAKLTGRSDIDSGVGEVKIDFTDGLENYKIKACKGIGAITLGGDNIGSDGVYGSGESFLEIDGGVRKYRYKLNINNPVRTLDYISCEL